MHSAPGDNLCRSIVSPERTSTRVTCLLIWMVDVLESTEGNHVARVGAMRRGSISDESEGSRDPATKHVQCFRFDVEAKKTDDCSSPRTTKPRRPMSKGVCKIESNHTRDKTLRLIYYYRCLCKR
jgi:hypothetical protein